MNAHKKHFDLGDVVRQDLTSQTAPAEHVPPASQGGVPAPMTIEQVAAVSPDERRQLNVAVPDELQLHRRTAMYREDHGMHATRQSIVAIAVDTWLRERGY